MPDMKRHLSELDQLEPPQMPWDEIEHRSPRSDLPPSPSPMSKVGVIALALLLTTGSLALVVRTFRGDEKIVTTGPTPAEPTLKDIQVLPAAWQLVVAYGSVWVTGAGGVTRVDSSTGQVVAHIDVAHVDESDIAVGSGHVWVTTRDSIVGINATTNEVDTRLEVQTGVREIAFADDLIYYGHSAEGNGGLNELNPATEAHGRSILTGGPGLGESDILPTSAAFWVGYSSPEDSRSTSGLVRVSKDLSHAVPIAGVKGVFSIAGADGFIWAVGNEVLYKVDADGTLLETLPIPLAGKVASDDQRLWLLTNTGSTSDTVYLPDPEVPARVTEIDTATGALVGDGVALPHNAPANIAAGDGGVWVSFYDSGILTEVYGMDRPVSTSEIATTLQVTCSERGTRATPETVRITETGVHIDVDNPSGAGSVHFRDPEDISSTYGFDLPGFASTTTDVRHLGPGTWVVRCFPDSVDSASTPLSEYSAPIHVVDPDGLWPGVSAEQATASPTPFVPVPVVDAGTARLEMTWPDGSTATLTYPAELDLLSTGVQPDLSYAWADDPPADHPIVFLHGAPGVEAKYVEGEPRATFPVLGGGVATLWAAADSQFTRHRDIGWWLVYRTDAWAILASLHLETNAGRVAASFSVSESATGFPFVVALDPLVLAEGFGESEGPVVALGDANAVPDVVTDLDGIVFLSPDGCSGGPELSDYYASNCLGDGTVFASIYGDPAFIRAVLEGVRVEAFSRSRPSG